MVKFLELFCGFGTTTGVMNFGKIMQFWLWNQNHHLQNHITSKREAQDGRDIKDGMAAAAASQLARSLGCSDQKTIIRRRCRPRQKCNGDAVQIGRGICKGKKLERKRSNTTLDARLN